MTPGPVALAAAFAVTACLVVGRGAARPPRPARSVARRGPLGRPAIPLPRRPTRLGAAVLVAVLLLAPAPVALAGLVLALVWWVGVAQASRAEAARVGQVARSVAECATALAADLAAGHPPAAALTDLATEVGGPPRTEARRVLADRLRRVAVTAEIGGDVPAVLLAAATTPGAGGLADVAAGWRVAEETGAGLAAVLSEVAEGIRRDLAAQRRLVTSLGAARSSARLLMALPVFGLLIGAGVGVSPLTFLLGPTAGRVCLLAGLALSSLGRLWTERIALAAGRG